MYFNYDEKGKDFEMKLISKKTREKERNWSKWSLKSSPFHVLQYMMKVLTVFLLAEGVLSIWKQDRSKNGKKKRMWGSWYKEKEWIVIYNL